MIENFICISQRCAFSIQSSRMLAICVIFRGINDDVAWLLRAVGCPFGAHWIIIFNNNKCLWAVIELKVTFPNRASQKWHFFLKMSWINTLNRMNCRYSIRWKRFGFEWRSFFAFFFFYCRLLSYFLSNLPFEKVGALSNRLWIWPLREITNTQLESRIMISHVFVHFQCFFWTFSTRWLPLKHQQNRHFNKRQQPSLLFFFLFIFVLFFSRFSVFILRTDISLSLVFFLFFCFYFHPPGIFSILSSCYSVLIWINRR